MILTLAANDSSFVFTPILARPHHVSGGAMCGTTPARPETARERHRDVDNDPL